MAIDNQLEYQSAQGLSKGQHLIKRIFDFGFALFLALLLWPIILVAYIAATLDTGQRGFFKQTRIGRYGKSFIVVKMRTMRDNTAIITNVTQANDPRITRLGQFFRRSKIDELPQLYNVLRGEMSFVGPRPDVPGFADRLVGEDRIILSVRPGITGPATLKFRNEQELLAHAPNPEAYNRDVIYPEKIRLNKAYVLNYTLLSDFEFIFRTIVGV